jgi:hypothetical protein
VRSNGFRPAHSRLGIREHLRGADVRPATQPPTELSPDVLDEPEPGGVQLVRIDVLRRVPANCFAVQRFAVRQPADDGPIPPEEPLVDFLAVVGQHTVVAQSHQVREQRVLLQHQIPQTVGERVELRHLSPGSCAVGRP